MTPNKTDDNKRKLVLKCSNITKQLKNRSTIIKDCSFSLYSGEALVVLSPPDYGKTTFAKIICGLVPPSEGTVTIRGNKAGRATNGFVSYQPEIPFVKNESTVSELMNMYSRFFDDFSFKRAYKLLKQFKISPKTKFEDLSITAIQIVETVLISSRKTSLYVFDEPLAHADPKYRSAIIDIIGGCKKYGGVVVFSQISFGLGKIADKILFIKKGGKYIVADNGKIDAEEKNITAMFKEVYRNA